MIKTFSVHPVAANLLMLIMILAGVWGLHNLNTQFLPSFDLNFVTVQVIWPGAGADDVERSITTPLEQELRDLENMKEMKSSSQFGAASIVMEFTQDSDMAQALDDVKEQVALVRNLPPDSETPTIQRILNFEPIAKVLITGPQDLNELRPLIREMERDLLDRGIAKVTVSGLPEQEIAIKIPSVKLAELRLSLNQIASRIAARSQDLPAGTIGREDVGRQLRSLQQQRNVSGFEQLAIISDQSGQLVRLGDIATFERRARDNAVTIHYKDQAAVELGLFRAENTSALKSADVLQEWLKDIRPQLNPGITLITYDESWRLITQRINLLIKNGIGGFILINIILFFFLNRRVAFWVAMGIPVSFMAAMSLLYLLGGSINMVSLFAFIMTLGIIVDDTIVVGEEALTLMDRGKNIATAVQEAALKMLAPISASSLTTAAAFFPLILVGGIIGTILLAIPIVVICVIFASLLECFLVLPGHLYHSFKKRDVSIKHTLRKRIDDGFENFKQHYFRRIVTQAIKNRWLTLSATFAVFLLSIGMVAGGHINFNFFPSPDVAVLRANVQFTAGTAPSRMTEFLQHMEYALYKTDKELSNDGESFILTATRVQNKAAVDPSEGQNMGAELGNILVELTQPDDRAISNQMFIDQWLGNINLIPNVESLTVTTPRPGPPGRDIDIKISGGDTDTVKQAAIALGDQLKRYEGVSQVKDDLPFGQEEYIYQLSPTGKSLELTIEDIGQQLRAAFNGQIVQVFHEPNEEIEVRVMLPDNERDRIYALDQFPIITAQNQVIPLENVVDINVKRGLNMIRHTNTEIATHVTADVNANVTNSNKILAELNEAFLPQLKQQYGIKIGFEGRALEQQETLSDMKFGVLLAFTLIYIILAWVFASYLLPVLIMLTIPLGLTGAILGHYIMGFDLTILSLFGIFGLTGIVINDSIILVNRYLSLRHQYKSRLDAVIETSCQRLRAVILTSLTTIAGLTPLLFETSLQAQFLIPMAISISFGLAFATILVLIVTPCLLVIYEDFKPLLQRKKKIDLISNKKIQI